MVGKRILHYQVEALLGAGGMGVVYRAKDLNLGRQAALKVLPPSALADPERRGRFVQEARTASSLSHPNIVTIYEIATTEIDGEPADVIAMEYVAGKTLDKLIPRPGMRAADALRIAAAVADALAAAHAAGIVHRDLKPSNVMVADSGALKLLDFGLAKFSDSGPVDVYGETAVESPQTVAGTILGTVAYMSPEQAEGKKVDARSDVFSFGVLLYELLTGASPFREDSRVATMSAILLKEPKALAESAPETPLELIHIVDRCLRKDPNQRWQSMSDLRIQLEDLRSGLDQNRTGYRIAAAAGRVSESVRRRWWRPAIAGIVFGGLAGALIAPRLVETPPPTHERLTFRRGDVLSGRYGPQGGIFYTAEWDGKPAEVFSVIPGQREGRPLGVRAEIILSISSRGEMALLRDAKVGDAGKLLRVPIGGGEPRPVLDNVIGADWDADGKDLAVTRAVEGKNRIEYPPGTTWYETEGRRQVGLDFSPSGKDLAFFEYNPEVGDWSVCVVNRKGERRVLASGLRMVSGLAFGPGGSEVWYSGARPGEEPGVHRVNLSGRDRPILNAPVWTSLLDVNSKGEMLFNAVYGRFGLRRGTINGGVEQELSWLDTSRIYELSPSGDAMLFLELAHGTGRNTAIYYRQGDAPAVHLGDGNRPALAPDASRVLMLHAKDGGPEIRIIPVGAGETVTLDSGGIEIDRAEWLGADQRRILILGCEPNKPTRTWIREISGGPARPITPEGVRAGRPSPNGTLLTRTWKGQLMIRAVESGEERVLCPLNPGETVARWSGDGKHLFTRRAAPQGVAMTVDRIEISSGRREQWLEVRAPEAGGAIVDIALSSDGGVYAYSVHRDLGNLFQIRGLR